jgi:phosphatidylinositol-3-phosphatase
MRSRISIACWKTIALISLIVTAGCGGSISKAGADSALTPKPKVTSTVNIQAKASTPEQGGTAVPHPNHVVIVIEENHSYSQIIGSSSAPYINSLVSKGAVLTNFHAITHPSEPNYLALFAGSTFGLTDDSCPNTFTSANLAQELIQAGGSFGGYSEGLPSVGYTGCLFSNYARKHNPWVNFTNVPVRVNMPFSSFPTDFSSLPTISIVIPNLQDDMHDGSIEQADKWLNSHIDNYVKWANAHNSLLVVTWDEDDGSLENQIPTIFIGPMVKVGKYNVKIDHYSILRTLEAMYGLPYAGQSARVTPITNIWEN